MLNSASFYSETFSHAVYFRALDVSSLVEDRVLISSFSFYLNDVSEAKVTAPFSSITFLRIAAECLKKYFHMNNHLLSKGDLCVVGI